MFSLETQQIPKLPWTQTHTQNKNESYQQKPETKKQTNKKTPTTAKQQFCKEKQQHEKGSDEKL